MLMLTLMRRGLCVRIKISSVTARLNWPYDSTRSLRLGGRLFQTCVPAAAKVLSPKLLLVRLNEYSSVGRTQLSDTGVGDELTVVGQVTRGVARQGSVDESRNIEHDALRHRKPVQLAEHRRDMIASPGARHEPGGRVLN